MLVYTAWHRTWNQYVNGSQSLIICQVKLTFIIPEMLISIFPPFLSAPFHVLAMLTYFHP